ncbi:MAG TPA: amidohydrolase family protein [Alphaproteobacteria bacterium]|nr:amidohydrolase family protein [Alphaproteobacteria bacterium]
MTENTLIRNAAWVIAWDEVLQRHYYLKDADVAFAGNTLSFVGRNYAGPAAREIDGRRLCVMPGLIDIHSHPMSEPMSKGFSEDAGNPRLGLSGLYDYMPAFRPDAAGMLTCAEVAYAELLRSGVTTLVDLSVPYPGWLDLLARSGLRGIAAPMFRSARWYTEDGRAVKYEWSADGGAAAFAAALEVVDQALNHPSARLGAMVTPSQVDTCTPELLRKAQAAARARGIPLQIHASQSLVEFGEMTRRHGITPLQWLDQLGLLARDTIIAHAIFVDSHSWIRWGTRRDLALLAERETSVAHCPTVFVRHGMLLEHFNAYREQGINLGLGTDTFPHNMLEELRLAALLGRAASRQLEIVPTGEVLTAATIGGAKALQRDDIGRLAPGAKADLVLIDLDHPMMKPLRDPLRSLVHTAAERAVRDVFVDGVQVVAGGRVTTLDYEGAARRLDAARLRAEAEVPRHDWGRRRGEELSPLSLPLG